MKAELESLFGTYWFTALQTHSKVLFPQGQRNYHIHVHFQETLFSTWIISCFNFELNTETYRHALQWQVSKNELPDAKDALVCIRLQNKICTDVYRLKNFLSEIYKLHSTPFHFYVKKCASDMLYYVHCAYKQFEEFFFSQTSLKTDKQATWRKHFWFPLTPEKNSVFAINKLRIFIQNTVGQIILEGAKMFLLAPWRRRGRSTAPLIPNHSNR